MYNLPANKISKHTMNHGAACISAEKAANSHATWHCIKVYFSHEDSTMEDLHFLLKMLKSIKKDQVKGNRVDVHWFYDHKTQLNMGWDVSSLLDMTFVFRHVGADC